MNIYLCNLIVILIFGFFCKAAVKISNSDASSVTIYNKKHRLGIICIGVMLILELGLRGDFMIDTINYYSAFNSLLGVDFKMVFQKREIVYAMFSYLVGCITDSYVVFLLLIAVIIVSAYLIFVYRESSMMWLSLLILICSGSFYTSFNIMRMILAVALFTHAYKYIYNEQWKKFVFIVLIVTFIHTSAIVLLLCYFLPKIKWERLKTSVVIAAISIVGVVLYVFADRIIDIVTLVLYSQFASDDAFGISYGVGLLGTMKAMIYSGVILINKKYFDSNNKRDMLIYNGCLVHFMFAICGAKIYMIQRFVHYFVPCVMLAYPLIISRMKKMSARKCFLYIMTGIFILSAMNVVFENSYYCFWENVSIIWR